MRRRNRPGESDAMRQMRERQSTVYPIEAPHKDALTGRTVGLRIVR